jgi:hypothetical protein
MAVSSDRGAEEEPPQPASTAAENSNAHAETFRDEAGEILMGSLLQPVYVCRGVMARCGRDAMAGS